MAAEPTTLMHYQRRATQLWERTEIIQTNSAELRAQIEKLRDSRRRKSPSPKEEGPEVKPIGHIPGLTFEESISPEALTEHLEFLEGKRRELQHKKSSHYVPAQVKADLDRKMSRTLERRDELAEQNTRLRLRKKQIKVLSGAVLSWEKSDRKTPLLEFVSPILQQASDVKVGFEDDDPSKIKASELLADYMERFLELFDGGQYEAAAFHAARSPHGALRNMETMEKFRGITAYEGERPPLLMFFQALMISVDAVKNPPGDALSVEAVRCTLQHGCVELVTHWVTQHRLTYSEALADVIFEHGQRTPQISNTCLALAQMVYSECAVHRKAVLCMCRRGMISGALEFIYQSKTFTLGTQAGKAARHSSFARLIVFALCCSLPYMPVMQVLVPHSPASCSVSSETWNYMQVVDMFFGAYFIGGHRCQFRQHSTWATTVPPPGSPLTSFSSSMWWSE
ncbi:CLHC1 protein, partial [Amia calva]|nr:CLHC1 protein [Amia calva]